MLQKHVPFDEKGSIILSFSTSFSVFRDTPLCPLPRNGWQYFGITQLFRSCLSDLSRLSIAHYLHLFRVRNTQQTAYEGIILIQRRFVKRLSLFGCEGWNRTIIDGFKGRCPTFRRPRNGAGDGIRTHGLLVGNETFYC